MCVLAVSCSGFSLVWHLLGVWKIFKFIVILPLDTLNQVESDHVGTTYKYGLKLILNLNANRRNNITLIFVRNYTV